LEQPGFDIKGWLVGDVAESMAIEEGAVIVSGTGAGGKPVGLLNSSVSFNSELQGESATITNGDALIKMQYNENLKDTFINSCVYIMKRATMGSVAVLKGTDGQYLMQSLPSSTEKLISGYPVVFSPSMPAIGAGAYPVLFADLKRAYALLRRPTAYAVVMDNLTKAYQGVIRWYFRRYVGGQPINTQAYLALKIATS
jgi:HK97 family phage major capsid protein